jgi:protein-L-isoaspartate(D-aspartate) O-methyltransferase
MTMTAGMTDSGQAGKLRAAMTDRLVADGMIGSPEVEAAFRTVPRHVFVPPGTPADDAYGADVAIITRCDENGAHLSSVSAPWLQARMIRQAGICAGMRVLEVGSGGYNAALLAEITGRQGLVVTMDIDPRVTARATGSLEAAGYGDRVVVVNADGEHGMPDHAPYDAIVVTAGAWDIPPAWLSQLSAEGILVLPLRMNTITRSLAFCRTGDHMVSTSAEMCGFVPMQGRGARAERTFRLPDPGGGHVALRFDECTPDDPGLLDGVLAAGPVTVWSGLRIGSGVSFADLHLWLAAFLPGFCRVAATQDTALGAQEVGKDWFPFGCARGGSFAYQASRRLDQPGGPEFEFGAGAYGPHAEEAAGALIGQIRAWDRRGRDLPGDAFTFWPAGTALPPPQQPDTAAFRKIHGTVTVSWPAAR